MLQNLILSGLMKVLCSIICQFCDCCDDNKDCPDGVCDGLRDAAVALSDATPETVTSKPQSFSFNFDWSKISEVVDAGRAFVKVLMEFIGKDTTDSFPVGDAQ